MVHTRELGLSRATDQELVDWAVRERRHVVTFDSDFAQIVALSGASVPSVMQLRTGPSDHPRLAAILLRALEEAQDELDKGAIVSVRAGG